jgi:hypothetical protein
MRIVFAGISNSINNSEEVDLKLAYGFMFKDAKARVQKESFGHPTLTLASCGGPWSDYLAISLYMMLKGSKLELYLPFSYDFTQGKFTGPSSAAMNYLHKQFGETFGKPTIDGPKRVREMGAKVEVEEVMNLRIQKLMGEETSRILYVYSPQPIGGFPRLLWNKWEGAKYSVETRQFWLDSAKAHVPTA